MRSLNFELLKAHCRKHKECEIPTIPAFQLLLMPQKMRLAQKIPPDVPNVSTVCNITLENHQWMSWNR